MSDIAFDITALGELLVDYTPAGKSPAGMGLFEQNPGGAPANVLACASKLGRKTAFIGKIGADTQGEFLRKTLRDAGINTDGLISDENYFTTLAFVSLNENGERSFAFARKPGADTRLTREDVNLSIIRSSRIFHFGSLSLTDDPARASTHFALEEAKKANCIISYDPNYRPLLWKNREQAKEQMRAVLPYVDMIKLSEDETELITGYENPLDAAKYLNDSGIRIAAVTLGKDGALIAARDNYETIPGFSVNAVDTTGAGDAFWGAFLYRIGCPGKSGESGDAVGSGKNVPALGSEELMKRLSFAETLESARFANAAAALCVTKRGAIPAMPYLEEVERFRSGKGNE